MFKRNFSYLCLVLFLCGALVTGCTPSAKNDGNNEPTGPAEEDFLVGEDFAEIDGDEGYRGPWGAEGCFTLEGGAIVFDTGIANAWLTLDFNNDDLVGTDYQYAVITIKTDNPDDAKYAHMKFGNTGKSFADWGIELTETYSAYAVDLWANGLTEWGDTAEQEPDFALNKVGATGALIYISRIVLTNAPPEYVMEEDVVVEVVTVATE